MENNTKTQNQAIVIVGLILLIIGLFIGVKLIFAGLDAAIDSEDIPSASTSQSQPADTSGEQNGDSSADVSGGEERPAPKFCPHCGDGMPESFQWGQFCPYCGKKVE